LPDGATFLAAIGNMRKDRSGWYKWLMVTFAPAIVTRHRLLDGIKVNKKWSDLVTKSDEAFVIVMVLNYWNSWVPAEKKLVSEHWGAPKPQYVQTPWPQEVPAWSSKGRGKHWTPCLGWNTSAVACYLDYLSKVKDDRAQEFDNDAFDEIMRLEVIRTMSQREQKRMGIQGSKNDGNGTHEVNTVSASLAQSLSDLV
jgi:hypothetical protein